MIASISNKNHLNCLVYSEALWNKHCSQIVQMGSNSNKILGLSKSVEVGEREILVNFRKKLKSEPDNIVELNEAVFDLMKGTVKPRIGLKLSEKIFKDIVDGSIVLREKIVLFLKGFKPISHQGFFDILKKKYGKTEGSKFEKNECEILLTFLTVPNDRSGIQQRFPAMKLKVTSSVPHLKLEIFGNSGCIYVFFYLKKIIETFLKNLPEDVDECYRSPSCEKDKSVETDGSSTDDSINLSANDLTKPSTDDSDVSDRSPSPIFKNTKKCIPTETSIKSHKTEPVGEIATTQEQILIGEKPTPVMEEIQTTENRKEQRQSNDDEYSEKMECKTLDCVDCALIKISQSITKLVEEKIEINLECSFSCLKTKDSLHDFICKLCELVCKMDLLDSDSMPQFKNNMKNVLLNIIQKMSHGAPGFYCRVLRCLESVDPQERDRLVVCLREILQFCLNADFGQTLYSDRFARRSLFRYLETTGSYFSFQSVVECLFKMFQSNIDLEKLLPDKLKHIIELFKSASITDFISYHDFVGEVSRELISNVYDRRFIDFTKLARKLFKLDDETLEICFDNFLYVDKINSRIFHFLDLGGEVYTEPINFNNLVYDEESNLLTSKKWNFYLEEKTIVESLQVRKKGKSKEPGYVQTDFGYDVEKQPDFENKKNENPLDLNPLDSSNDDGGGSDKGMENLQTVKTKITIKKDDVMEYWDGRPSSKNKRQFNPGSCGANWPRMYNSPCCVVCGYNYVTLVGSQKRFSNFGKLHGVCKICKGSHIYVIKESPFVETLVDGDILYTAVKDMEVDVFVTGKFHMNDEGLPDVANPVHDKDNAAGLHLKGKQRQKMAKRAAEIGVKGAYMEQLDNANIDELQSGNKTSIKSIPVIKMARREKEKQDVGGLTFYQAVMNVYETQQNDVSPNFEATSINKGLPGYIRKVSKMI